MGAEHTQSARGGQGSGGAPSEVRRNSGGAPGGQGPIPPVILRLDLESRVAATRQINAFGCSFSSPATGALQPADWALTPTGTELAIAAPRDRRGSIACTPSWRRCGQSRTPTAPRWPRFSQRRRQNRTPRPRSRRPRCRRRGRRQWRCGSGLLQCHSRGRAAEY